jgi:hypothetical protein
MMSKKHAFSMQPRDCDILEIIGLCGALTSEQIGLYIWETVGVYTDKTKVNPDNIYLPKITVQSNGQRRMKLLHEAGFVQRVERFQTLREGKKSYFYTLTATGAEALASVRGDIFWRKTDSRLRPNYVEHLIMTNDVRLAIMRLAKKDNPSGLQLIKWRDELTLANKHKDLKIPIGINPDKTIAYASLVPDAYAVLCNYDGHENRFFIEVDRGSETAISTNATYRTWEYKIGLYMRFIFPLKDETESISIYTKLYQKPYAKLLTITTSEERRERLIAASEKVGAQKRFWFTTHADIMRIGLQQIIGELTNEGNPRYAITLPNIWSDKIWRVASDKERRLHSLSERSEEIRRQL